MSEYVKGELLNKPDIEKSVLGTIMNNNEYFNMARDRLKPELFYNQKCKHVFEIISKIIDEGKNADLETVTLDIYRQKLENIVLPYEVVDIYSSGTDVSFGTHLAVLEELYYRRSCWFLGQRMVAAGTNISVPLSDIDSEMAAFSNRMSVGHSDIASMKDANAQLIEHVSMNRSGVSKSHIPTGFSYIDKIGGFQLSDFNVIAADSSQGKTTLALNISMVAASKNIPVMFYSLEMQIWQLAARINSYRCNISSNELLYKRLTPYETNSLDTAISKTDNLPIFFDCNATSKVENIITSIRANNKKHGIKMYVVDYIQILSSTHKPSNNEQFLGDVARAFKNLAKELNVCILALSQISRDKADPRPTLARVRASGQIVEAADTVLLIYRPGVYGRCFRSTDADPDANAELIIAKGRNIGTGSFIVGFDKKRLMFYDKDMKSSVEENEIPF